MSRRMRMLVLSFALLAVVAGTVPSFAIMLNCSACSCEFSPCTTRCYYADASGEVVVGYCGTFGVCQGGSACQSASASSSSEALLASIFAAPSSGEPTAPAR